MPDAHIPWPKFRLVDFLLVSMILVVSSGCSLELAKLGGEVREDPIILIRRELRQVKADQRVAVFDLRREQKKLMTSMQASLLRIEKANESVGQNIAQLELDIQRVESSLGQKNADIDERFTEMERQHRLIHGRIEEEANRMQEMSSRASDFSLKEIDSLRTAMTTQDAEEKKLRTTFHEESKAVQDQLTLLKDHEGQTVKALQKQIDSVRGSSFDTQKLTEGQAKAVKEVSDQLSQITDKVVPAVNGITTRLDNLELQFKRLDNDVDSRDLKQRLADLAEAVDVQRQSLEMLGNTLTSQVDRQRGLLQKTSDRLDGLEASSSSKPK